MKYKQLVRLAVINVVLICFCSSLKAETLNWHGFVAQGIIQSNDSNFVNHDGDPSVRLTEIGINASYRLNQSLRLAGQAVYLNGGNRYPEGLRMDYLFLDWKLLDSFEWQVNLNVGRFKNYHWQYSSTRDVPHTRPSIILPQSIYFDVFRDVSLGSDGVALIGKHINDFGEWDFNWSYGRSEVSDTQQINLFTPLAKGELKQDFDHQLSLSWQPHAANFEVGVAFVDADFSYRKGPQDGLVDGNVTTQRSMLRLKYESENWDFSSEIMKERVIFDGIVGDGLYSDVTAEGGYIQGQYFVSPSITAVARLDLFDLDRTDRDGQIRQQTTGIPAYFAYMDQFMVGLSWDFTKQWKVRGEFHRVKGAGRLAPVILPDLQSNNSEYWDVWAVQFMYWF